MSTYYRGTIKPLCVCLMCGSRWARTYPIGKSWIGIPTIAPGPPKQFNTVPHVGIGQNTLPWVGRKI